MVRQVLPVAMSNIPAPSGSGVAPFAAAAVPAEATPAPRRPARLPDTVRPHAAALASLAALVLFLFRDAVLRGQVFYHRDVHLQWSMQAEAFVRAIAAGS